MKNVCLLLLLAMAAATTHAQSASFNYPDAFYFVKEINVSKQTERPFHLEITVKENPADSLSKARIYAIQVRKGKEDIIGRTMTYAKIASNGEWNTYSIDGITDKAATRIWLYAAVNGNGDYYFDNISYSIADHTGTLLEADLSNQSFEDHKLLNGYFVSPTDGKNIRVQKSPVASEGKQAVLVSVTGQKPAGMRTIVKN
ncbi:MAG: hypothetical protein KGO82_20585 [Bacteroidota bacterium]|nr:hypothetical protein [Bacteroidota bacterium]